MQIPRLLPIPEIFHTRCSINSFPIRSSLPNLISEVPERKFNTGIWPENPCTTSRDSLAVDGYHPFDISDFQNTKVSPFESVASIQEELQ